MNKNTLIMCIMLLCTYLILPAQNIDLELSISSSQPNPEIYTTVPLTFTLKNNGNTAASNIRVRTGVCDSNGNFSIFGYNSTIVTSSNPASATVGTYDIPFQNWDIPQLAAGQTATLDFFVFTLSEEEETILGQVMRANETDTDSSPSNLENCNVSEDDEASFKLNEADSNGGGNENCQLSISDVVFPSTVKPGETVNVQALITNNSTTAAAVPTAVNVYQFLDGGRIPYTTLIQNGATVPSLAPNGSTIVNFTLDIPNPLYRNTFFPIDGALINKGDFYLIIQEDAEGGTTSYLECNQKLEFEIDYPNIDLSITLENNQNCYGNDRIVQADLRVTNLSNITTTAPIFVNLRQPPVFINPDLNGELEYVPLLGSVYWRINGNLAPGQSVTLNRPYRLPSGSTGAFDLRANIAIEGSNIEDINPTDNEIVSVFDFDPNCGGTTTCNYTISDVVYPTDVRPGETGRIQARVTNNSTTSNNETARLNLYRYIDSGRIPTASLQKRGPSIPNLAPGASTILEFDFSFPDPLYIDARIPTNPRFYIGKFNLIAVSDNFTGVITPSECDFELLINPIFPNADLELALTNPNLESCFSTGGVLEQGLKLTNLGTETVTGPVFIFLGNASLFNINLEDVFVAEPVGPSAPNAYWQVSEAIEPGETINLNNVFKVPDNQTTTINLNPKIINGVVSNTNDLNPSNDAINVQFSYDPNCEVTTSCDYNNLPWLNEILADSERLCQECTNVIEVYEANNTTYINILTGTVNCLDGGRAIYNCDGSIFCIENFFDQTPQCQAFDSQNPQLVATLWDYEDRCAQEEPVIIAARAWRDLNGDGFRDLNGGDQGLGNVRTRVESITGEIVGETLTEVSGRANFPAFPAGTYRVIFDIPTGLEATIKDAPGVGSGQDSEINPDGKTDFFTFAPGDSETEIAGGFRTATTGEMPDLELSVEIPNTTPGIYKKIPVTYTIRNTGNEGITGIKVKVGLCQNNGFASFVNSNGLVNSSPAPVASRGEYSISNENWIIPILPANSTATLVLNLFTLTDDEKIIMGEVQSTLGDDEDSTPGNWTTCTPVEDDEASVSINGSPVGGDKPDFNFTSIGYFTSYTGTLVEVTSGSALPVRTTVSIPFHGVNGTSPTPNTSYPNKTKIYLSRDQVIDAQDIVLSTLNLEIRSFANTIFREGGLGAFSIPSTTAPGVYNIIAKIDADDEVDELNENNNTLILSNISITDESCPCPQVVNPVCGSDGVTYNNACEAECAGITDYTPGVCDDCICTQEVFPVCGSDGVTYPNPCEAECAGITEYTPGACPVGTDGVDLELELVAPATYAIYTKVLFQARVTNTGTINAEGVKIDFKIPDGFVHSSNSASTGAYDLYREEWNVGIVKAGTSEVLDLTLFALSTDEVIAYAQVTACKQEDVDSTPANGSCCIADEDDEAVATVASAFKNVGNTSALRTQNIHTDLQIKSLYPTTATDEINLFVQSKLPELHLTIYNLQGEPVLVKKYTETIGFQRFQIDVATLPTGMYLVRFEGTTGKETLRFVKMQM